MSKKESIEAFVDQIKLLKSQREILVSLNKLFELYPDLICVEEGLAQQDSIDTKYIKNSVLAFLNSLVASSVSVLVAEKMLDSDDSTIQRVVAVLVASMVGFNLFQKDNRKKYLEDSVNNEQILRQDAILQKKMNNIFDELDASFCEYVRASGYSMKDFLEIDFIKNIFNNNLEYIEMKKYDKSFDFAFNYDKVVELFDYIFGEDGINYYLETISDNDSSKVIKR